MIPLEIPADETVAISPREQLLFSETITIAGTLIVEGIAVQV